jgi:predicted permease
MAQPKFVVRRLLRAPMFTGVTILTLAIGIGANTAIFSVIEGVLLKPLPFPQPDRLIAMWQTAPGVGIAELNACPATYFIYREEGRTFEDVGLWRGDGVSVTGIGEPEMVRALDMTDGVLPLLGVRAQLGRIFTRQDDSAGSPQTAMLTHGYWQRRFGGDPSVLGRRILMNGTAREIIGVLPRDFRFLNRDPEIVLPLQLDRSKVFIGNFSFQGIARLKPGVTLADANADVARMLPMLVDKFPPAPGMNAQMIREARLGPSLRPLKSDVVGDVATVLWVIMGTVGIVLLIACANVANLTLVRAEGRQHELAIRAALGAGRWQVARELLFESIGLGIAGGIAGLGLAAAALRLLQAAGPANLPRLHEISIDPAVLLFDFAISLGAGLLFGSIPVLRYAGPRLAFALRESGRGTSAGRQTHRARAVLVVGQVALALVLLVSSGLMIRTMQAMKRVEPGFTHPEDLLSFRVSIPEAQVKDPDQTLRLEAEILRRIAAMPGVASAATLTSVPMDGQDNNDPIYAEDHVYSAGEIPPMRRYKAISPGTFQTLGRELLAGRDMNWTDEFEKRPVVMISANLARELWGGPAAALGKRVRETSTGTWREVVGVVADEHDNGVNAKPPTVVYWPLERANFWGEALYVERSLAYVVRSPRARSAGFVKEAEQAVWSVNPNLTISGVRTVEEIYERSMAPASFALVMLSLAAGMALLLGVVGIYGVVSYSVAQRTREIGIRMALGAERGAVVGMFVRVALTLAALGASIGLAAAAAMTRLMSSLLFGVRPIDPLTYGAVAVGLLAAVCVASCLPALRASGIAPVTHCAPSRIA